MTILGAIDAIESDLLGEIDPCLKVDLSWLKENQEMLSAVEVDKSFFSGIADDADAESDFRWSLSTYVESVYYAILGGSDGLLMNVAIEPIPGLSMAYEQAFDLIKERLPEGQNKELISSKIDLLTSNLYSAAEGE